jgi:hypothetical protein
VNAINPGGPESVPLLLYCLSDKDPEVAKAAAKVAGKLFTPENDSDDMVWAVAQTVAHYQSTTAILAAAAAQLMRMGPKGKSAAIDLAVLQLAQSYAKATASLRHRPIGRAIEAAIIADQKRWSPYYEQVDSIRRLAVTSSKKAQDKVVELIAEQKDNSNLHQKLAELITDTNLHLDNDDIFRGLIVAGRPAQAAEMFNLLHVKPEHGSQQISGLLESEDASVRFAALRTLKMLGLDVNAFHAALTVLLKDPADDVLYAAAGLLGRKDILSRAMIPGLLADLRSQSPNRRSIAARQLDDMHLEPEEITKALIRAVDRRDMPSRQGLINAIQSAYAARADGMETLKQTAERSADPSARSFARAALREMDLTKAENEVKP